MKSRKTIKVTISMSVLVDQWAQQLCEERGYDNFSAFISDLIRREKDRQDLKRSEKAIRATQTEYKIPSEQQMVVEEDKELHPKPTNHKAA